MSVLFETQAPARPQRAVAVWRAAQALAPAGRLPTLVALCATADQDLLDTLLVSTFDARGNYVVPLPAGVVSADYFPLGMNTIKEHPPAECEILARNYTMLGSFRCGLWTRWSARDLDRRASFEADTVMAPLAAADDGRPLLAAFHLTPPGIGRTLQLAQVDRIRTARHWIDLGHGVPFLPPQRL
jgi:hypothetical protein